MALIRPTTIIKPFADDGDKNTIPIPTQVGITVGAASYETGFPPSTMTDISLGGIAPDGMDMNGILNEITDHLRFLNAGGQAVFDSTLVTEIGGYPVGVVLQDNAGINSYRNILALNTTDFNTSPEAIGVSWILQPKTPIDFVVIGESGNFTVPTGVTRIDVEVWGAGGSGGGGGLSSGTGAGGGGGGYTRKVLDVTPGEVIVCTIGIGGAAKDTYVSGEAGGTTSFGSYLSATGGDRGMRAPSQAGGVGGVGIGGTLIATGSAGGEGDWSDYRGGTGGGTPFGAPTTGGDDGGGRAGKVPGAGGGGGGPEYGSGAGANGLIIVRY